MANPFSVFRKQQKTWMACLGVMVMIAFIFGSAQCDDAPVGARANSVVASTRFVNLRESDIEAMRFTRQETNKFFGLLANATATKMAEEMKFGPQFGRFFEQQISQRVANRLVDLSLNEQALVDTIILAHRAEEMGMVVSDAAITEFIAEVSDNKLDTQEVRGFIKQSRLTDRGLYNAIRQQMLAANLRIMVAGGFGGFPPAENWEFYQQLKRRAVAEVIPVPVSDFVAQVKDPSDDVLKAFFDEHKNKVHVPLTADPGFKQPDLAAFQYLKADYDRFLDEKAITEKEIEEHYEKFKDQRYLYSPPPPPLTTPEASETPAEEKAPEKTEAEKTEADKPKQPTGTEPQVDGPKPDAGKPEEPKPDAPKTEEPKTEPKTCERSADDTASCQDPPRPAAEPELKPAGNETPAAETKPDDSKPEAGKAAAAPAGPSLMELVIEYTLPRSIREGVNPKHDPLWKVEGRIRAELARQKASEKIAETLNNIRTTTLDKYFEDLAQWKAVEVVGEAESFPKPARPDFPAIALANKLSAHETSLLSVYDFITTTDLGRACQREQMADEAFRTTPLFKGSTAQDEEGNQFLFWKVEFSAEHVPDFADPSVRENVLNVWKEIQARALAKRRAEELAAKATAEKGKPLAEAFQGQADVKVQSVGPFTWITEGLRSTEGQAPPRLTTIEGVEAAGNDFMKAVFSTEAGGTVVAFNQPETVAYVVRVEEFQPLPTVLRTTFLVESGSQAANYVQLGRGEAYEAQYKWLEELRTAAGLHWNRDPYQESLR